MENKNTITKTEETPDYIKLFSLSLNSLKRDLKTLAKIYCDAIAEHPEAVETFRKSFPNFAAFFPSLLRINSGTLREELFFISGTAGDRARRLTLADQTRLIESGVPCLTASGDYLNVKPETLTPKRAEQLITPDGAIRSLNQQRAWVEDQKMRTSIRTERPQVEVVKKRTLYEVKDGFFYFYGNGKIGKDELFKILGKMI